MTKNVVAENIMAMIETHPELAALTDREHPALKANDFLADVGYRFRLSGTLSERQVAAVLKTLGRFSERAERDAERDAAKADLIAAGVKAPTGKVQVTGEIVKTKIHDGQYGMSYKMIVKAPEGWSVWATIPTALRGTVDSVADLEGKTVTFLATLERSDRDALFAFAKRPTRAELV